MRGGVRRLRASSRMEHSGGTGTPPGTTTSPRQELAVRSRTDSPGLKRGPRLKTLQIACGRFALERMWRAARRPRVPVKGHDTNTDCASRRAIPLTGGLHGRDEAHPGAQTSRQRCCTTKGLILRDGAFRAPQDEDRRPHAPPSILMVRAGEARVSNHEGHGKSGNDQGEDGKKDERVCCKLGAILRRNWTPPPHATKRTHVAQQLRPSLPHHHLGRKPRAGDRLRGRRLPARHPPDHGGHPGLSRQAQARPVEIHDPTEGARHSRDPLRRIRDRGRRAVDHGHAHRARDQERGCAVEGLRGHQGQVPPRPRRLHLFPQIRSARLAGLGPRIRAGDGQPRRSRRRGAESGAGLARARRAGAGRALRGRPR